MRKDMEMNDNTYGDILVMTKPQTFNRYCKHRFHVLDNRMSDENAYADMWDREQNNFLIKFG